MDSEFYITRLREHTEANRQAQAKHSALFARLFPEIDFEGGRCTLRDVAFSGTSSFHRGEREVRVTWRRQAGSPTLAYQHASSRAGSRAEAGVRRLCGPVHGPE